MVQYFLLSQVGYIPNCSFCCRCLLRGSCLGVMFGPSRNPKCREYRFRKITSGNIVYVFLFCTLITDYCSSLAGPVYRKLLSIGLTLCMTGILRGQSKFTNRGGGAGEKLIKHPTPKIRYYASPNCAQRPDSSPHIKSTLKCLNHF